MFVLKLACSVMAYSGVSNQRHGFPMDLKRSKHCDALCLHGWVQLRKWLCRMLNKAGSGHRFLHRFCLSAPYLGDAPRRI